MTYRTYETLGAHFIVTIDDFADYRQFEPKCRIGFGIGRRFVRMGSREGYPYSRYRFWRV